MSRIRFALAVATLFAVATSTVGRGQERTQAGPACTFPASPAVIKPTVVGPDVIAKRVEVVQPLDSPIRILGVDFTGATLTIGGTFRFTHDWSVDVVNVTDQVASGIGPMVWVYSGSTEGAHMAGGFEPFHRIPLGPGERRILRGTGTVTGEIVPVGDDVHVRVGIASAYFDTCTWNNYRNLSPRFAPAESE